MEDEYESSDNEDYENIRYDENSKVLVAIDCCKSMFDKSETLNGLTGMQTALRALNNVYDDLILTKITKNKIAVIFFHPDADKMVLMDFDAPLIDLIKKLKELSFANSDKLDEYRKDSSKLTLNFSNFLIECRKKFKAVKKTDFKYMIYVTNNADPCDGDVNVKFQSLQAFRDFKEAGIAFKLAPVVDEFDYSPFFGEAYEYINETEPKYYYNLDFLTALIKDTVRFKSVHKKIQLHLSISQNFTLFIPCLERRYSKDAKLLPNKTMTRDLETEAHKTIERQEQEEKFRLQIPRDVCDKDLILTKEQKLGVQKTEQIKTGLTIIHASTNRYSRLGEHLRGSRVIKPKGKDDPEFLNLWEACVENGLNLLCYLKYKESGKVHSAELTPKMINLQRQFLVVIIPHCLDLFQPVLTEEVTYDKELCSVFDDFVDRATIEDYDLTKIRPYVYSQQVKYFKRELLEEDYADMDGIADLVHDKQYKGDVASLTSKLNSLFPPEVKGSKRGKNQAGATSKRGRKN